MRSHKQDWICDHTRRTGYEITREGQDMRRHKQEGGAGWNLSNIPVYAALCKESLVVQRAIKGHPRETKGLLKASTYAKSFGHGVPRANVKFQLITLDHGPVYSDRRKWHNKQESGGGAGRRGIGTPFNNCDHDSPHKIGGYKLTVNKACCPVPHLNRMMGMRNLLLSMSSNSSAQQNSKIEIIPTDLAGMWRLIMLVKSGPDRPAHRNQYLSGNLVIIARQRRGGNTAAQKWKCINGASNAVKCGKPSCQKDMPLAAEINQPRSSTCNKYKLQTPKFTFPEKPKGTDSKYQ
ncbi:hypothetical protein C8R44DRAFT_724018 [Mycena epipterygia]|nr:hypothetical protein C8R44DRAFT_724018 [Mycena epipterygia]